jgi:hypothetical protein
MASFLFAVTFIAATVNGALGYGFSSITVPLALLFLSSRALNPALVTVEVFMNLVTLIVNRRSVPAVWPRLKSILLGILIAVIFGAFLLRSLSTSWLKFGTYVVLLPLLFLQVAGVRRPLRIEGAVGAAVGGGVGLLYALTTISGPPLALLLNNEGLGKEEFRAALGVIRVFESIVTFIAYFSMGMITAESLALLQPISLAVLIGIPLGAFLIRRLDGDVFRRLCMSFDVLIVGFGLSRIVQELGIIEGWPAWIILTAAALLDGILLYRFFTSRGTRLVG